MVKKVLKAFYVFIAIVLTFCGLLYLQSVIYSFEDRSAFAGDHWYNPYAECHGKPFTGNFHAHSNAWNGLTNGKGDADDVMAVYNKFRFDFASMSDYHKVSQSSAFECVQPPAYEHGYGALKNHQIVIGAKDITWFDFPVIQNLSNKQYMLNRIRSNSEDAVIALAHPSLRSAYSAADLSKLSGYDCFEALNKLRKSFDLWDAALSSGSYSYILGSDDVHNYTDVGDIGRCGTVVLAEDKEEGAILRALKNGHHYAIEFPHRDGWTIEERARVLRRNPELKYQKVHGDSLFVQFSERAAVITIYSDHHQVIATFTDTSRTGIRLPANATFARVEATFGSGHSLFLNPVARSSQGEKPEMAIAEFNWLGTFGYRIVILLMIGLCWLPIFLRLYGTKKPIEKKSNIYPRYGGRRNPDLDGASIEPR